MKCLKCGYVTSESKETCSRCGSPLPPPVGMRAPARPRQQTPATTPNPQAPETGVHLPDWRKEVSRKVKEYGEKKKILTTPPQPLRGAEERGSGGVEEQGSGRAEEQGNEVVMPPVSAARPKIVTDASLRIEPPHLPPDPPEPPAPEPMYSPAAAALEPEPRLSRPLPALEADINAGDLGEDFQLEAALALEPSTPAAPLYLGRRAVALAIDSTILVALHAGLLYLCAEIISRNFRDLFADAWLPLTGIFLLFHCLYYAYFYMTSRQTPGQVFFGIELRDPNAGTIALGKVLSRWFSLVFLNVFNLVPVLTGRRFLLLDRISGTEIRTLK